MTAATLTGLLANDDRLRVVSAIALGARTIDDVVKAGGVAPQDAQRALPRLIAAGSSRTATVSTSTLPHFETPFATDPCDVVSYPTRRPSRHRSCGTLSRTAA